MPIQEIVARSLLRRHPGIDSWFVSWGGMNLYRGCSHDCVYCDGRSEKYRVEGEFSRDIGVKSNALELLERELDPARRRRPFPGGFLMLGGGVGDLYQPIEKKLGLARGVLQLALRFGHPVHLLSKSTGCERDIDLLGEIGQNSAVLVSFSFSSSDDALSAQVEPGAAPPSRRLEMMARLNRLGIPSGAFLMPVLPALTDSARHLGATLRDLKRAGCRYVVFSGLTLKDGRQKDHYLNYLERLHPELLASTRALYPSSVRGAPDRHYQERINRLFFALSARAGLPRCIPLPLFAAVTSPGERLLLVLQQLADLADMSGTPHRFRLAYDKLRPLTDTPALLAAAAGLEQTVRELAEKIANGRIPAVYRNWIGGLD